MLSRSSLKYFTLINKLKYQINKFVRNEKNYFNLILKGVMPRPHYAFGLFFTASLANQLNIKKFSVIEFGCWQGEGLMDIEHFSEEIEKIFNVEIDIYGFEGGEGLPPPKDFKDRLYQFSQGKWKQSQDKIKKNLKKSKLIIGKFEDTVPKFMEGDFSPIGCIFNDADYYSSTSDSFKILNDYERLLPKVLLYFDDLNFSSQLTGELGAINNFNKLNELKIEEIPELAETMALYWKKWLFLGKRFFLLHNFKNKLYNTRYTNPFYKNLP